MDDDLIDEGIVRELISKVQNLRKTKNFNITDRINIYYSGETDLVKRLKKYIPLIKKETLCIDLINEKHEGELYNLNGLEVTLNVERV